MKHLPFDHQHDQRQRGEPAPQLALTDLLRGGGRDGRTSDLNRFSREDVRFVLIEKIDGEIFDAVGIAGDEVDCVVAEFVGLRENGLIEREGVRLV